MITIFSLPRPFAGEFARIQNNAIASWKDCCPNSEIILFGDEVGTGQICKNLGCKQISQVSINNFGTPYINMIFIKAQEIASFDVLCYFNADIILMNNLEPIVQQAKQKFDQFLLVANRVNLKLQQQIDFKQNWHEVLKRELQEHGTSYFSDTGSVDCFVFSRGFFSKDRFPPFLLGRERWDNFLVYMGIQCKIAVIDIGTKITIIHQAHTPPESSLEPQRMVQEKLHNSNLLHRNVKIASKLHRTVKWRVADAPYILQNNEIKRRY